MNLYFISGLGIDKRIFQKLALPSAYRIHYLEWIPPLPEETIHDYAIRLSSSIDKNTPFTLIGLSFGGMIASEMTAFLAPQTTIIISSVATANELPPYLRIINTFKLHKLVPTSLLKRGNPFLYWLFGAVTKEQQTLLKQVLKDTDDTILNWSINAIVTWKKKVQSFRIIHIHGNKDYILPIRYSKPTIVIEGGTHLMILSHNIELSGILTNLLAPIP